MDIKNQSIAELKETIECHEFDIAIFTTHTMTPYDYSPQFSDYLNEKYGVIKIGDWSVDSASILFNEDEGEYNDQLFEWFNLNKEVLKEQDMDYIYHKEQIELAKITLAEKMNPLGKNGYDSELATLKRNNSLLEQEVQVLTDALKSIGMTVNELVL